MDGGSRPNRRSWSRNPLRFSPPPSSPKARPLWKPRPLSLLRERGLIISDFYSRTRGFEELYGVRLPAAHATRYPIMSPAYLNPSCRSLPQSSRYHPGPRDHVQGGLKPETPSRCTRRRYSRRGSLISCGLRVHRSLYGNLCRWRPSFVGVKGKPHSIDFKGGSKTRGSPLASISRTSRARYPGLIYVHVPPRRLVVLPLGPRYFPPAPSSLVDHSHLFKPSSYIPPFPYRRDPT
jgi:hypothetical protein